MFFSISQIREFINRERVFTLMFSFILLVNAWLIFAEEIPGMKESFVGRKVFGLRLSERLKDEDKYQPKASEKILLSGVLEKEGSAPTLRNILGFAILLLFGLGLFLDICILTAKIKKREVIKTMSAHLEIKWGIYDIFKLGIIFVFLGYILQIVESQVLSSFSPKENIMRFVLLLNTGIMDLVLLGFIIYFVKIKFGQSLAAIGLKIENAMRNIFLGLFCYIAFLPALVSLLLLIVWLTSLFNYQPPQQTLFNLFLHEKRIWLLVYATTMVVFLGPIVEEVFFRGFAYNAIKRRWGMHSAIALTAIVFAGLHATLVGFLPIMALGFLLAYMYEKTGSLVPSITIHILHNTLMVGFLFLGRYFVSPAQ